MLRAVEIDPENSGALMNLANALVETGDISEASQCILKCFQLTPQKKSLHTNSKNLLPAFVQNQLFEFSADIYKLLLTYSSLSINEHFNYAMCNYQIHRFNEAVKSFEIVLSANPKDATALVNISKSYYFIGNVDKAIFYSDKLISEEINPAQGMSMKAQYLHQSGRFNEAEKYLLDILTKFPMTDFLWLTLGDIYSKEKLFNKALNCYQKTRQIKKQKGASDSDKDLIFIEQKINDTKKNAL